MRPTNNPLVIVVLTVADLPVNILPEIAKTGTRLRHLHAGIFESLAGSQHKLALLRYDYNYIRPYSSLGNKIPAEARRELLQSENSTPGALTQPDTDQYQPQGLTL